MTIEEMVAAHLTERRLRPEEAKAVVKMLKTDSRFTYLENRWQEPEDSISGIATTSLLMVARFKVLTWMDKYHEKHPARALFTGAS